MGRALNTLAVALAFSTALAGCGTAVRAVRQSSLGVVSPPPTDMSRARTAWAYFTPAVPAEDARGAGFVTPASLGDDIAATYAARRLGLIDRAGFDRRIARLLAFLRDAPLSSGVLPGRYMNVQTGELVDPPARAADPGWSGVEVGRLLVWLRLLAAGEPRHAAAVTAIVARGTCAAQSMQMVICCDRCRVLNSKPILAPALPMLQRWGCGLGASQRNCRPCRRAILQSRSRGWNSSCHQGSKPNRC